MMPATDATSAEHALFALIDLLGDKNGLRAKLDEFVAKRTAAESAVETMRETTEFNVKALSDIAAHRGALAEIDARLRSDKGALDAAHRDLAGRQEAFGAAVEKYDAEHKARCEEIARKETALTHALDERTDALTVRENAITLREAEADAMRRRAEGMLAQLSAITQS